MFGTDPLGCLAYAASPDPIASQPGTQPGHPAGPDGHPPWIAQPPLPGVWVPAAGTPGTPWTKVPPGASPWTRVPT